MTSNDAIKALQAIAAQAQARNSSPLEDATRNGVTAGLNAVKQAAIPAPTPIAFSSHAAVSRIDRNLSDGKLYVYFNEKPHQMVIDDLKQQKFWWNPQKRAWHNFDTAANREFLTRAFNAEFDNIMPLPTAPEPEPMPDPDKWTISYGSTPIGSFTVPKPIAAPDEPTPALLVYKQQVDSLTVALNMSGADLMMHAIDCLYKQHMAQAN